MSSISLLGIIGIGIGIIIAIVVVVLLVTSDNE